MLTGTTEFSIRNNSKVHRTEECIEESMYLTNILKYNLERLRKLSVTKFERRIAAKLLLAIIKIDYLSDRCIKFIRVKTVMKYNDRELPSSVKL